MGRWIDFGPGGGMLVMFSKTHFIALTAVFLGIVLVTILAALLPADSPRKTFRTVLALLIAAQQLSLYIWYTTAGKWDLSLTLPLQMCDLSVFLSVAVLLTKKQLLTEVLYYWGFAGAIQALLTPDIGEYTFPHFVFYQFFLSHGFILLTCIYLIAVEKFRPSSRSVLKVFGMTNLYALIIYPVNKLTGGNYLFLSGKPVGGSLLDFLGPWPWYILSLEGVALVLFLLLYLPFAFSRRKRPQTGISA